MCLSSFIWMLVSHAGQPFFKKSSETLLEIGCQKKKKGKEGSFTLK